MNCVKNCDDAKIHAINLLVIQASSAATDSDVRDAQKPRIGALLRQMLRRRLHCLLRCIAFETQLCGAEPGR